MREPGGILLVACYELGHQPLSLAWPAAFLERSGFAPAVMDLSVEPFDAEKVRRARVVAIAVPMHTALRLGVAAAQRVREINPSCHLCFYGLYATLNAEYLLAHGADSVIGGEVEEALADLVARLAGDTSESSAAPIESSVSDATPMESSVSSLAHMGGTVSGPAHMGGLGGSRPPQLHSPRLPQLKKLRFPRPSRAQLPSLKKYAMLERDGRRELAGYVEASRGCRHRCRHCPIPPVYGGRFFVVPRQVVLDDVRQLVAAGATHITFGDPDFLNGPGHAFAVARDVHAEFAALTFDMTAKVEHLLAHRRRLPELAALGCLFIVSAVESLSDTVLAHLDKGHTRADVIDALAAVRAAGITLRPTWVPFTPWTTLADYRDMLDFIERETLIDGIDPVQYSIRLLVPPGSLLLESPAMRPHLGRLVAGDFYYEWRHPDPAMERLHRAVTAVVAEAAERAEDAAVTFDRVRRLADAGTTRRPLVTPDRPRPPRLTEPWFC